MLSIFTRPSVKNQPQNFIHNEPPPALLNGAGDSSVTHCNDTSVTHSSDALVTEDHDEIGWLLVKANNAIVGLFFTCPICQTVTRKTRKSRTTCSHKCRQKLYKYRRESGTTTHYIFNADGSIVKLNRWKSTHIKANQLDSHTIKTAKIISRLTRAEVISVETLEEIKRQHKIR